MEIIGQEMANTVGPLFYKMPIYKMEDVLEANHLGWFVTLAAKNQQVLDEYEGDVDKEPR